MSRRLCLRIISNSFAYEGLAELEYNIAELKLTGFKLKKGRTKPLRKLSYIIAEMLGVNALLYINLLF
jgi:hypothetical protein